MDVPRAIVPRQVSYAELYNETIYDLLSPSKEPNEISLSEDSKGCAASTRRARVMQRAGRGFMHVSTARGGVESVWIV